MKAAIEAMSSKERRFVYPKAICVSWISNLECTMFVERYVLCHNTCKS
jgi:hypothetical protein